MNILKHRKKLYIFSTIVMLASVLAISFLGLKLSIDFAGGELFVLSSSQKLQKSAFEKEFKELGINSGISLRSTEVQGAKNSVVLRSGEMDNVTRGKFLEYLKDNKIKLERMSFIGPIVGNELKKKATVAIILTVIAVILFIAWAFREVSRPVSSWKYGFVAILALVHDILVPAGVFAALGYWMGAEIDTLFVMALLAILGYSVNDTIVIFDRVRERLSKNKTKKIKEDFEETVGKALDSTIVRSVNTSLTTALVLVALYLFGAESTRYFALTLLAGVLAGTYSSIFLAAPLLVDIAKFSKKK